MPVNVTCPECGKGLKAPDEVLGKKVACPGCNTGFLVPAAQQAAPEDGSVAKVTAQVTAGSGAARFKGAASAPAERPLPPPPPKSPEPRLVRRAAQHANFIADKPQETRVQLGADGQLPDLVLRNDASKDKDDHEEEPAGSNPLLLIGVLCFSITVSVVMLFLDVEDNRADSVSKAQAREQLQAYYTGEPGKVVKPHERLLREAIQAHNRGDYALERRRYRRVLDMLHDESYRGLLGLTRWRKSAAPPNDLHLEELLSSLLRND